MPEAANGIQHRLNQRSRNTIRDLFDKMDTVETAILGLTEAVIENREMILENARKFDALIERLDLPCG